MQELEPILDSRMDEMVRAELGIPNPPEPLPIKQEMPDDDLEPIDMEVKTNISIESKQAKAKSKKQVSSGGSTQPTSPNTHSPANNLSRKRISAEGSSSSHSSNPLQLKKSPISEKSAEQQSKVIH
jgi:hypothetical protein